MSKITATHVGGRVKTHPNIPNKTQAIKSGIPVSRAIPASHFMPSLYLSRLQRSIPQTALFLACLMGLSAFALAGPTGPPAGNYIVNASTTSGQLNQKVQMKTIYWVDGTTQTTAGAAGGGGGNTVAAPQFSLPYYSLQGSSTQLSAFPGVTASTNTGVTISTLTAGTIVDSFTQPNTPLLGSKVIDSSCIGGSNSASNCYSVFTLSKSTSTGASGIGVAGTSNGDGLSYGVYGQSYGTGTNYAGFFDARNGASNYAVYVNTGTVRVQTLEASQFLKTDASKILRSYDLLNSTQSWTGGNTFSSATVQNITINGTCTGAGCGSGGVVVPSTFTWGLVNLSTVTASSATIALGTISTATVYNLSISSYATFVGKPFAVMNRSLIAGETDNPGNLGILGTYNTPSGAGAGYNVGGISTLRRGTSSGSIQVGSSNMSGGANSVCIGDNACTNQGTSASNIVGIGGASLNTNSSGTENSCVGYQSCFSMTSGGNSCLGAYCLNAVNSGTHDTCVGWGCLVTDTKGSNNACIGDSCLESITSGIYNTSLGSTSGADITTGLSNTCMGAGNGSVQSCTGVKGGSANTMLGAGTGDINFNGSESSNTIVGYSAKMGVGVNVASCLGAYCLANSSFTATIGAPGYYGEELDVYASTTTPYELTLGTSTAVHHVTVSTAGLMNLTSVTGAGLATCGDATHGLGWSSTNNLFTCQSITGTGGGGGASTLEVMANGVRVSSPTPSINEIAGTGIAISGASVGGSTAAITIALSQNIAQNETITGSATVTGAGGLGVTYGVAAGSFTSTGSGNAIITEPNGLSGQVLIGTSTTNPTVGHMAVWGSSITLIDGGVPGTGGGTPGGPNLSVQVSSAGVFGGFANFTNDGSTITITSTGTVINNVSIMTQTNVSTVAASGVYFNLAGSSATISSMTIQNAFINSCTGAGCGGGGGASTLEVMANGLRVSSPTVSINAVGNAAITVTGSLTGGATAQLAFAANPSSVTLQGVVTAASLGALTANQSITWTGSGDVTGTASGATSLTPTLTAAANQPNIKDFASAITVRGSSVTANVVQTSTLNVVNNGVGTVPITNSPINVADNVNTSWGANMINRSNGSSAASYWSATSDLGGPTSNYMTMGIVSSHYNAAGFSIVAATAAFIYSADSNLEIGAGINGTQGDIIFGTNFPTSSDQRMKISSTGTITTMGNLNISSGVYLNGNAGSAGQIFTSGGPGTVPTFAAAPVVYSSVTVQFRCPSLDKLETNFAVNTATSTGTSNYLTCSFDNATRQYVDGFFKVPDNLDLNGTITIRTYGRSSTAASSKNVGWILEHQPLGNGTAYSTAFLTSASNGLAVSATQGANDTLSWSMSVASSTWTADQLVNFRFSRDVNVGTNLASPYYDNLIALDIPVLIEPNR